MWLVVWLVAWSEACRLLSLAVGRFWLLCWNRRSLGRVSQCRVNPCQSRTQCHPDRHRLGGGESLHRLWLECRQLLCRQFRCRLRQFRL